MNSNIISSPESDFKIIIIIISKFLFSVYDFSCRKNKFHCKIKIIFSKKNYY